MNGHIHTAVMAAKTRGCKQNAKVIVKEAAALGNALPSNMSRLALGDIGNIGAKVSGSTINGTKRTGAIKKEILNRQPLAFRQKSAAQSGSAAVKDGGRCSEFKISDCVVSDVDTCYKASALPKADSHEVQQNGVLVQPVHHLWTMSAGQTEVSGILRETSYSTVEDIDAGDKVDPQLASDYVKDIYSYLRQLERKYAVRPCYLQGAEISGKMRAILVDWLCQVHLRFHLLQETLYVTVSIIDRYLQRKLVTKNRLQLVGVTAMLIASKYEEMFAPEVADFVFITDNAYTKADIHEMERDILRSLDFSFGRPLCLHFLRRNSKAGQVDSTMHTLAKYLMELSILEHDMVHIYPSEIAAAALYLSIKLLDNGLWTDVLAHYSYYTEGQLLGTAAKLARLILKADISKLTAIQTKYNMRKLMKISSIPELKLALVSELAARS